jgi:hypothetical protein
MVRKTNRRSNRNEEECEESVVLVGDEEPEFETELLKILQDRQASLENLKSRYLDERNRNMINTKTRDYYKSKYDELKKEIVYLKQQVEQMNAKKGAKIKNNKALMHELSKNNVDLNDKRANAESYVKVSKEFSGFYDEMSETSKKHFKSVLGLEVSNRR